MNELRDIENRLTRIEEVIGLCGEPSRLTSKQTDQIETMLAFIRQGQNIDAIRIFRTLSGKSLKESKVAVMGQ